MSLSPLYPSLTTDLHVMTATSLHQNFFWLRPAQAQLTIYRVLTNALKRKSFKLPHRKVRRIQIGRCSCRQQGLLPRRFASLTFIARHRILNSTTLAHMLDSLVRVSRRGVCSHLLSTEKPSTQLPRNIPTHPRRDLHSVLLPPKKNERTDTQHNSPPKYAQKQQLAKNALANN